MYWRVLISGRGAEVFPLNSEDEKMRSTRKRLKLFVAMIALASTALVLFSACGEDDVAGNDDQKQNDPSENGDNACGGEGTLTFDGATADPGDSCGPCEEGELECADEESLECVGAADANACGGCDTLDGEPGDECGDDGVWECAGENAVQCNEDDLGENACGGEDELTYEGSPASPEDPCGPCDDGALACESEESLTCEGASETNECGGCQTLEEEPGESCGDDDEGIWRCDGDNALECDEEGPTANACGGLGDLDGEPGEPCQEDGVDGVWDCDGTEDVKCVEEPDPNDCGGNTPLPQEPGEPCADDGGTWECDGEEDVYCDCNGDDEVFDGDECLLDDGTNACGGDSTLPHEPGTDCAGGDGSWGCYGENDVACECDDPTEYYDGVECVELEEPNDCGGETVLPEEPGTDCADGDGSWECDGEENVVCECADGDEIYLEIDGDGSCETACSSNAECGDGYQCATTLGICVEEESNACGGDTTLPEEPGTDCADGSGTWNCDGSEDVACECDDPDELYDGTQCVDDECLGDDDCASDEMCFDNECVVDGETLCEKYCGLWYGCPRDECGISGIDPTYNACLTGENVEFEGCVNDVENNREAYEDFVYFDFDSDEEDPPLKDEPNQCEDVRFLHCGYMGFETECGCDTPGTVGDSCTTGEEVCEAGDLAYGECYDFESEDPTEPGNDGLCYAGACYVPGDVDGDYNRGGGCGSDNVCLQTDLGSGDLTSICLDVDFCESNAECSTGESCQLTGEILYDGATWMDIDPQPEMGRVCFEACEEAADCVEDGADTDGIRCGDAGNCELPCGTDEGEFPQDFCEASGGECVDAPDDPDVDEWCALD